MADRVKKTHTNLFFFGQVKHLGNGNSFTDFCSKKMIYGILVANVARISIYRVNFRGFFYRKWRSSKISYILYVWWYLPNIVYISPVSLKKISLKPDPYHWESNQNPPPPESPSFQLGGCQYRKGVSPAVEDPPRRPVHKLTVHVVQGDFCSLVPP